MGTKKPRIRAFLEILGFRGKPQSISKILGIDPDEAWSKGDIIADFPPKGVKYTGTLPARHKFGSWMIKSHLAEDASYDIEDHMKDIMKTITPIQERIKKLPASAKLILRVWIDIFTDKSLPAIGLEIKTMEFLVDIHAEFDVDISLLYDYEKRGRERK